jgi:hypothetical protein
MEWGVIGPFGLTHFVKELGLTEHALPPEAFYPLPFTDADLLFAADAAPVEAMITPRTRAIHLWSDMIKARKREPPPAGSFIAKMCERYGIR